MSDASDTFLSTAQEAASRAAEVLRAWAGKVHPREKGPKDLVTEADLEAQQTIYQLLEERHPDHDRLGEEDREQAIPRRSRYRWIVDPLDGTANFVHGLPGFAVSIALECDGEIEVGVVRDVTSGDVFHAKRGAGSFLNDRRLASSGCQQLSEGLIAASLSADLQRGSMEIRRLEEMLYVCRAVRRLGSAALNLCYVAAGRLDGYWAGSVKIWDVAAGELILLEAGGALSDLDGQPFRREEPRLIAAASEPLRQQIQTVLTLPE